MNILKSIENVGKYSQFILKVFNINVKRTLFLRRMKEEVYNIGYKTIGITFFLSIFIGAIVTLQSAYSLKKLPFLPGKFIGTATRQSMILEFGPTLLCIILTGKIGAFISTSIGTMRITEQIDAVDVMGINSANMLVFPKIIAGFIVFPVLVFISIIMGIFGGYFLCLAMNIVSPTDYILGIQQKFNSFYLLYAFVKTEFFSFIIISISSFFGYYVENGAVGVGNAGIKSVVWGCVLIIIFNFLISQLMLF